MKSFRIILSILVLFVFVVALAVSCLVFFVNPNRLKPIIAQEVMKQTGYQLMMAGKLSWSFYPRFGVNIEQMMLSAPDQSAPFINLHNVNIATDFFQLMHGIQQLQGDVYIADVQLEKLHMQKAHVGLHWQNNVLTLQPLVASLYEGSLNGIAHGRQLAMNPKWDWDVQLSHIQIKPLLSDIANPDSKIKLSGTGDVKLQASTKGNNKDQFLRNLNGTSQFNISNGVIEGIDLNYLVQSADAMINKKDIPNPVDTKQTMFDHVSGSAVIKNGVVNTDNLLLSSSVFTTKGEGSVDLVSQTLSYQLQITPLQQEKIKWAIPVLVEGTLHQPSVHLDLLALNTMIAGDQLDKVKTEVKKEIKKLPAKVNQFLQRLTN